MDHKLVWSAAAAAVGLLLLLAAPAAGATTTLTGKFVVTQQELANAELRGTFYYLYDSANPKNSRVRYSYNVQYQDHSGATIVV